MAGEIITVVDLGTLGGNTGRVRGMSTDGTVVVGYAQRPFDTTFFTYRNGAFRWTEATGMVDLGNVPAGEGGFPPESHATNGLACSADGNVIVGEFFFGESNAWKAFRWTQASGMTALEDFGFAGTSAMAISADGSVIVGRADIASSSESHAFRWTQAGGMVDLGAFGSFSVDRFSEATAVSADGTVVIGRAYTDEVSFISNAFRWTEADGMVNLGTLGGNNSFAYCCSADGSVIYGRAHTPAGVYSCFRWTASEGMTDLGDFTIRACSEDGSVGYGYYFPSGQAQALRWTEADGVVELGTLGGNRSEVWATSADGVYGGGYARNESSYDRPALWTVAPPPPFWTGLINCEVA